MVTRSPSNVVLFTLFWQTTEKVGTLIPTSLLKNLTSIGLRMCFEVPVVLKRLDLTEHIAMFRGRNLTPQFGALSTNMGWNLRQGPNLDESF